MDINSIGALFEDFDLAAFLPEINTLVGWVETLLRLCVMAGPLLLLGFGLLFLLAPPKEANHGIGYRFWWSMASLDAWQFTHHIAGMVFTTLGLILTIVMSILCNGYRGMETEAMLWSAAKSLGWIIGLTVLACLAIDLTVVIVFDHKGFRRREPME